MRGCVLVGAGCMLTGIGSLSAQSPPALAPSDSALLAGLDGEIETAVVQGDTAALDTLYAPDFRFTHSTGTVDGRAEWLRRATAEPKPFQSRTVDSVSVEMHGSTALTSGRLWATPRDGPGYVVRYVRLYVRHGARWQLTSHRSVELRELGSAPH